MLLSDADGGGIGGDMARGRASTTSNVWRLAVTPELLARIPADEKVFFLVLGHMANELNTLQKLVILASNHSGRTQIEKDAQATQSLVLVKLLSLKACAGYEFIRKNVGRPFWREYVQDPEAGLADLDRQMKSYFRGNGLLRFVRNKFTVSTAERNGTSAAA